jgi:hypothetical protein
MVIFFLCIQNQHRCFCHNTGKERALPKSQIRPSVAMIWEIMVATTRSNDYTDFRRQLLAIFWLSFASIPRWESCATHSIDMKYLFTMYDPTPNAQISKSIQNTKFGFLVYVDTKTGYRLCTVLR